MHVLPSWRLLFLAASAAVVMSDGVVVNSVYPPIKFSVGSPWPLPASIATTTDFQQIDAVLFHFNVTRYSCDILELAFIRYFDIIFHGRPYPEKYSGVHVSRMEKHDEQQLLFKPQMSGDGLKALDVALSQECEKWPSLEMDESCKLSLCNNNNNKNNNSTRIMFMVLSS